jgi:anti-anti-sigma factor
MDSSRAGAAMAEIGAMAYGSHGCLVSDQEDVTRLAVAGYVSDGLAAGDRVLCVLGLRERPWLEDVLGSVRTPVQLLEDEGSLVIAEMGGGPIWQGEFSPVEAAQIMFDSIDAAVGDGFRGLRVWSDMSWAPVHRVAEAELVEMERLLQAGLGSRPGMGLCMYDPGQFTASQLRKCAEQHDLRVGPGRAGGTGLQILETARGLRLIGEADLSTAGRLEAALRQAALRIPRDASVIADLSSLAFADSSAVEVLLRAASRLGPGRFLILRSASPTVRKVLAVLDRDGAGGIRLEADPAAGGTR